MFVIVVFGEHPECPPIGALDKIHSPTHGVLHLKKKKKEILYVLLWNDLIEILSEKRKVQNNVEYTIICVKEGEEKNKYTHLLALNKISQTDTIETSNKG